MTPCRIRESCAVVTLPKLVDLRLALGPLKLGVERVESLNAWDVEPKGQIPHRILSGSARTRVLPARDRKRRLPPDSAFASAAIIIILYIATTSFNGCIRHRSSTAQSEGT